jgi:hypothetical protein
MNANAEIIQQIKIKEISQTEWNTKSIVLGARNTLIIKKHDKL